MSLEKFFEILSIDPDRACYGYKSVEFALKEHAVETLLISDKLFRAKNVVTRKQYVRMVEDAENNGIKNLIFSSMNPAGESNIIFIPFLHSFYRTEQLIRCCGHSTLSTPRYRYD